MNNKIEICFYSDIGKVKPVVFEVLDFLDDRLPYLTSDIKFDLRLVFDELLCNAVIHGNNLDATKKVYIQVEIVENAIFSKISDEGAGFDYLQLLVKQSNTDESLMNENGRGIRLVNSLTDSIAFNAEGNQIEFYKRVASDG